MSLRTCMSIGATFTTFCHHSVLRRSCWRFGGFSFPSIIANPGICSVTYESLVMISVSALTCMMTNISKSARWWKILPGLLLPLDRILLASICQLCNGWNFQSIFRVSRNTTGDTSTTIVSDSVQNAIRVGIPVFFWSFWQPLIKKRYRNRHKGINSKLGRYPAHLWYTSWCILSVIVRVEWNLHGEAEAIWQLLGNLGYWVSKNLWDWVHL